MVTTSCSFLDATIETVPATAAWGYSMSDRVFNQRLQDEVWYQAPKQISIDLHLDTQSLAQPQFFDLEVLASQK